MIIIPSIDLQNGNCVRLVQGDFGRVSQYPLNPVDMAARFSDAGASVLHIVDLDGAKFGKITQIDSIKAIRKSFNQIIQVGGGIRSEYDIDLLLNLGVDRVVIGSIAVLNQQVTTKLLEKYGADVVVLALDFFVNGGMPYLAIKGWQEQTKRTVWEVLDSYPKLEHLLCTDISKDGMQIGPNFEFYEQIKSMYPAIKVQASGGVSTIQDILELKKLRLDAAIIGKALYEGKLDLSEIISC